MNRIKTFGERIKEHRIKKGWTQTMLAKKIGIDTNLLGKYERDLHIPHIFTALDIAEALGCSVYELTCYKENERGEMSRYIDANWLFNTINQNIAEAHNERCVQLLEAILYAPTADVVEVVRCKDCKYCLTDDYTMYCERATGLDQILPDDFCSYGERKEQCEKD